MMKVYQNRQHYWYPDPDLVESALVMIRRRVSTTRVDDRGAHFEARERPSASPSSRVVSRHYDPKRVSSNLGGEGTSPARTLRTCARPRQPSPRPREVASRRRAHTPPRRTRARTRRRVDPPPSSRQSSRVPAAPIPAPPSPPPPRACRRPRAVPSRRPTRTSPAPRASSRAPTSTPTSPRTSSGFDPSATWTSAGTR